MNLDRPTTCTKVAYDTRRAAQGEARRFQRKGIAAHATPYHCPHCGLWHLTSMSRKRANIVKRTQRRRDWLVAYHHQEDTDE